MKSKSKGKGKNVSKKPVEQAKEPEKKQAEPKEEERKRLEVTPELQAAIDTLGGLVSRHAALSSDLARASAEKKRIEKELEAVEGDIRQAARDVQNGGAKQLPLTFETKKEQLPPAEEKPATAAAGKLKIQAEAWEKLSQDDQRRIKHHVTECGAALGEAKDGTIVIANVPPTLKGTALKSLLHELSVAYTLEEPATENVRVRLLVRFHDWEAPNPGNWSKWLQLLEAHGVSQQKHDMGWMTSTLQRGSKAYLELTTALREEHKWGFDVVAAKAEEPAKLPAQLPAPLNPDEAATKHAHAVYVRLTGSAHWERRYEGATKADAIAAFNAATKECAHERGEARRYEAGTLKRQFPLKKNGAPEQAVAN